MIRFQKSFIGGGVSGASFGLVGILKGFRVTIKGSIWEFPKIGDPKIVP